MPGAKDFGYRAEGLPVYAGKASAVIAPSSTELTKAEGQRTDDLEDLCIRFARPAIRRGSRLAVEQCRFIQAKPEREACYQRQEAELAAKRKPEPTFDTKATDSLRQMRQEDDEVYRSLRSICRGC